jgi:hypothetical protein
MTVGDFIASVDPADLTADDRVALLDLVQASHDASVLRASA